MASATGKVTVGVVVLAAEREAVVMAAEVVLAAMEAAVAVVGRVGVRLAEGTKAEAKEEEAMVEMAMEVARQAAERALAAVERALVEVARARAAAVRAVAAVERALAEVARVVAAAVRVLAMRVLAMWVRVVVAVVVAAREGEALAEAKRVAARVEEVVVVGLKEAVGGAEECRLAGVVVLQAKEAPVAAGWVAVVLEVEAMAVAGMVVAGAEEGAAVVPLAREAVEKEPARRYVCTLGPHTQRTLQTVSIART